MLGLHVCQQAVKGELALGPYEDGRKITYLNAFELDVVSRVGGVPVREEAPESSPGRPRDPPGPRRRPLLLRDENIEVGPSVTFWLDVRLADPLRRRRSSIPTWLLVCWA